MSNDVEAPGSPPLRTKCFIYFLRPGCADEYDMRHAQVWPEVITELRATGVVDYTIYRRDDLVISIASWVEPGGAAETLPHEVQKKVDEWHVTMAPLFLSTADEHGAPLYADPIFDINEDQYAR